MSARTTPLATKADLRAERHARTFAASQRPYCAHVHRLKLEGYNAHQIAHLTRTPMIDVRLILASIDYGDERAELLLESRAAGWAGWPVQTGSPTHARQR
jgi:hypothetical protein